jgi:hypothetical protein
MADESRRAQILDTAKELIDGDRARTYGDATDAYRRIGIMWGALLNIDAIPPHTALTMMQIVKQVRGVDSPGHADSWIDNVGYGGLAGEAAAQ